MIYTQECTEADGQLLRAIQTLVLWQRCAKPKTEVLPKQWIVIVSNRPLYIKHVLSVNLFTTEGTGYKSILVVGLF